MGKYGSPFGGPRSAVEVRKISNTHDQVLNWLVLNPHLSLRQCADHFGYSQGWLSSLINSDIFQAALKQRQLLVATRVAQSIPERLTNLATIAVDKLTTMASASEDPQFMLDVTDKVLHRMGYAPSSARNPGMAQANAQLVQNNNTFIGVNDLAEARAIMGAVGRGSAPGEAENVEAVFEKLSGVGSAEAQTSLDPYAAEREALPQPLQFIPEVQFEVVPDEFPAFREPAPQVERPTAPALNAADILELPPHAE